MKNTCSGKQNEPQINSPVSSDCNSAGNPMPRHQRKKILLFLIPVLIAAVFAVGYIYLRQNSSPALPSWVEWLEKDYLLTDQENVPSRILLTGKKVTVYDNDQAVWDSGEDVRVQDFLWADINHDEKPELLLLCWKIGRYGSARPFWEKGKSDEEDDDWSQHIYIYAWEDGTMTALWMASDIGMDAASWSFDPATRLNITETDGHRSRWDWLSWGLELISGDDSGTLTFAAVGDNLIHSIIMRCATTEYHDSYYYLYEKIRDTISTADASIVNQETPLVDDPGLYSGYPEFGTPIEAGNALKDAGFDIVTCANNHALDKGTTGIETTKQVFDDNGMLCLGIQSSDEPDYEPYELYTENGVTCALLNYTYGTNSHSLPEGLPYTVHLLDDPEQIRSDIEEARSQADAVLLFVHWGTEYSTAVDESQSKWTQLFLDSGVDVVVGTHPHVLQPYEMLTSDTGHEMLVYYSLGNFIAAQDGPEENLGGIASFTLQKTEDGVRISSYDLQPLVIHCTDSLYSVVYPLDQYTDELAAEHPYLMYPDMTQKLFDKLTENKDSQ